MVSIMEGVVQCGTAQKLKVLERPIAGKTGTTNDDKNGRVYRRPAPPSWSARIWVSTIPRPWDMVRLAAMGLRAHSYANF